MNRLKKTVFAIVLLAFACGDKKSEDTKVPTNLNVAIDVTSDGSGKVTVVATSDNTAFYNVFFGESTNDIAVNSLDGRADHTYGSSGTYTVTVEAHASQTAFVTKVQSITVNVKTTIPAEGYSTPTSYSGMTLVWQDEFSGTSVNEADWTFEIGTGGNGWGNNELEYYKKENATIEDGNLVISAKRENFQNSSYTSTRMITKDKKTFKFGRIDIRAVLPKGQGIWPALWMLGNNISTVNWPACGEIDMMEMIGGQNREKTVYGTLHWDNGGHVCTCDKPGYSLPDGIFNDKFHVFSTVWTESSVTWYVDDVKFNKIDITPADMSEFRNEYFFIFNLAVGGQWPGSPDGTTTFPQHLIVDYIRVFQ
jgi:beta-glucanase (GH16 family)